MFFIMVQQRAVELVQMANMIVVQGHAFNVQHIVEHARQTQQTANHVEL